MNRTLVFGFAAIVAAAFMFSCMRVYHEGDDEQNVVDFSSVDISTRAAEMSTEVLEETGFRVFAWETGADTWEDFTPRPAAPDFMELTDDKGMAVTWNGNRWTYAPVKYWPGKTGGLYGNVSFFAYSPATGVTAVTTSAGEPPKLSFTAAPKAGDQADLVANARYDRNYGNTNYGNVEFTFDHLLSKIGFQARLGIDYGAGVEVRIEQLALEYTADGIKSNGVYTFPAPDDGSGAWSEPTSAQQYMSGRDTIVSAPSAPVLYSTAISLTDSSNFLMLLPQQTAEGAVWVDIDYSVTEGARTETYKARTFLPALEWAPGMQHIYTVYLMRNNVHLKARVLEWNDGGNENTPVYVVAEAFSNSVSEGGSVADLLMATAAVDATDVFIQLTEDGSVSFGAGQDLGSAGLALTHDNAGSSDAWTSPARATVDGDGKVVDLTGQPSGQPLITVGTGVTLTLRNITFKGLNTADDSANNTAPLIRVDGGTLVLEDVNLEDNTNIGGCDKGAGGVDVKDGTFTMSGGTVSGNTGKLGGGVALYGGTAGTFTLNGGIISGNRSLAAGGGVYVANSSYAFTHNGGTVNAKDAGTDPNTSDAGHEAVDEANGDARPVTVDCLDLTSLIPAPAEGATPTATVTDCQYTGSVTWTTSTDAPVSGTFEAGAYKATVSLTAASGYTFNGISADAFTHSASSATVKNEAGTGMSLTVTVDFR